MAKFFCTVGYRTLTTCNTWPHAVEAATHEEAIEKTRAAFLRTHRRPGTRIDWIDAV